MPRWQDRSREAFPPLFSPVRLREREDAFARACAEAGEAGAGTIYHVGRFDLIECAVVFEPDEPLAGARRVVLAGMNALAETIAADCPPERTIRFAYPAGIVFDEGLVGGARLAWPEGTEDTDVPEWLVFALMVRTASLQDLGFVADPALTTLEESGFRDIDPEGFVARFCRHLMVEIDEWQAEGFRGVANRYLARLPRAETDGVRGIDGNGDLLVHPKDGGGVVRTALVPPLLAASWYDPASGGPKS